MFKPRVQMPSAMKYPQRFLLIDTEKLANRLLQS
jgi:hypothetical protein